MMAEKKPISCCSGRYRIELEGRFYCMRPPGVHCSRTVLDVGAFTNGKKKILYCQHRQEPCEHCENYDAAQDENNCS